MQHSADEPSLSMNFADITYYDRTVIFVLFCTCTQSSVEIVIACKSAIYYKLCTHGI